jgi:hypothetical protein
MNRIYRSVFNRASGSGWSASQSTDTPTRHALHAHC